MRTANYWTALGWLAALGFVLGPLGSASADAAPPVRDTEACGDLGSLLGDLLGGDDDDDEKEDKKDKPAPAPAPPPHADRDGDRDRRHPGHPGGPRGDRNEGAEHRDGGLNAPYHQLSHAERHRIRITDPTRTTKWEHGDDDVFWSWDEDTVEGKVRFELWHGRERLAEVKGLTENDGRAVLGQDVNERWGSGRNFYLVAIDARRRIGVSEPFTLFGGPLITSPSWDTVWVADAKKAGERAVTWEPDTMRGPVRAELYRGDRMLTELRGRTDNDGRLVVQTPIDERWGTGDDYRIRLTDRRGRSGFSESFRIQAGPVVTYPDRRTRWQFPAKNEQIRWDTETAKGGKVDLTLLKDGREVATIKERVPNDGVAHLFDGVDPKWGTGDDFQIRITDGQGRVGLSERFAIRADITVTKPSGSNGWQTGNDRVQITWDKSTATGELRFELWSADGRRKVADLGGGHKNNGETKIDPFPAGIDRGRYRVKATDTAGHDGWSEVFDLR